MARYTERDVNAVYQTAETWKTNCLLNGKALLWPDSDVWSFNNLQAFKRCFIDNPDESGDSFENKFKRQLEPESDFVTKLACEIVLVHFLFPSNVSGGRKRELISEIASWKSIEIANNDPLGPLDNGIGGPGIAYNTRRPFELGFIGEVALRLASMTIEDRVAILDSHVRLRELLGEVQGDRSFQGYHMILHLLYPDHYERIASNKHKQWIAEAFSGLLEAGEQTDNTNDRIYSIRKRLEELLPGRDLDFYWTPLRVVWFSDVESEDLSPLQALEIKKQIVFYGPPGTGKTHEASAMAENLIRRGILRKWGPNRFFTEPDAVDKLVHDRIKRVQFHPGYGYEDLIRGLQLGEGGQTKYKSGVLLQIVETLKDEEENNDLQDVPFVLILDEMNRADLSKVLGECFLLFEDRDGEVELSGQEQRTLSLPSNLYFIGTMNLIDQSLEQVDFALRRRFLWFPRGFSRDGFLQISHHRWEAMHDRGEISKRWERFEEEFEMLADRAAEINAQIEKHASLGPQYLIGHTYFCDVVYFAQRYLAASPGRHRVLFTRKRQEGCEPVQSLWRYSLKPLLEQYLTGIETHERKEFIDRVQLILLKGTT